MSDELKLFNDKKPYGANQSLAKAVLMVLGYRGVWDFAKRSCINHQTAGAVLGTCELNGLKHGNNLIKVHEALHSAYMEKRPSLRPGERRFVTEWAKRWRKNIFTGMLWTESPWKLKDETEVRRKDRERKRVAIKASIERSLFGLKWE